MGQAKEQKKPSDFLRGCVSGVVMVLAGSGVPQESMDIGKIVRACQEIENRPKRAAKRAQKNLKKAQASNAEAKKAYKRITSTIWI